MAHPILSLFCGCGGFDLGFEAAGFEAGLALDVDKVAVATYNFNRSKGAAQVMDATQVMEAEAARVADLSKTTGEQIIQMWEERELPAPRGIVGGSPCQTFSGGNVHFDIEDIRHTLPRSYAAILSTLNNRYELDFFVFENVRGITFAKHRETFGEFKVLFEQAGFRLFEGLLDAVHFGVAQNRPRVFVVGINRRKYPNATFTFPETVTHTPAWVGHKIRQLEQKPPLFFCRKKQKEKKLTPAAIKEATGHPNHWAMQPRSPKFHNGFLKEGECKGRSFRVLSWIKPSWTVAYGNREVHVHPSGTRRLSVYEAMLLQDFPANYELLGTLSQQIRQVSDAIPPPVGQALGQAIARFLEENAPA